MCGWRGVEIAKQSSKFPYTLYLQEEWWWIFDESVQEIGAILLRDNFVVVDDFIPVALGLKGLLRRAVWSDPLKMLTTLLLLLYKVSTLIS